MLLLTVFALGVFFTSLPLSTYLSTTSTYTYIVECATLFLGVSYNLPGVFDSNPYKNVVNGSLWTMPHEVRMYAILAIVWIVLIMIKSRLTAFKLIVVIFAFSAGTYLLANHFHFHSDSRFPKLFFMFFVGAAFYVLREYITLTRWLFWIFIIALSVATSDKFSFYVIYICTIGYILFYLAYVPSGFIRRYNQLGDYSYGVYIYAFPVQQAVAALIPGISVSQMIIFSSAATILLATLSWHYLERRCLNLKAHYVGHTRKVLLAFGLTRQSPALRDKAAQRR